LADNAGSASILVSRIFGVAEIAPANDKAIEVAAASSNRLICTGKFTKRSLILRDRCDRVSQ
jgi:hypothetical protein